MSRPRRAVPADAVAGLFFVGLAVAAWALSAGLPVGQAMQMGPAYVPRLVAAALGVLGAVLAGRALPGTGPRLDGGAWRALVVVLASILAFAALVRPADLAAATVALVAIASLAAADRRWAEVAALAGGLAAFAIGLFCYLLRLPIRPWP